MKLEQMTQIEFDNLMLGCNRAVIEECQRRGVTAPAFVLTFDDPRPPMLHVSDTAAITILRDAAKRLSAIS